MYYWIVLLIMVTFVTALVLLSIHREARDYNHGICPRCESQNKYAEMRKLKKFDEDSQGGRGYVCDHCGYVTWVSYDCVDCDYKEDNHD